MFNRTDHLGALSRILLLAALVFGAAGSPLPARAQPVAPVSPAVTAPVVAAGGEGVRLAWGAGGDVAAARAAVATLPRRPYQGYLLPMHLVTLALPAGVPGRVQLEALQASDLPEGIAPTPLPLPPALDWTPDPNASAVSAPALPTAPIFVLREGDVHGQRFVVVAVSPIYAENGAVKIAGALQALVPGATELTDDVQTTAAMAATAGGATVAAAAAIPVNDAARQASYKIVVSQPGIQEVLYSAVNLPGKPATAPKLTHDGQTVAVELATDRFRFYAPAAGDRWNATAVYWLMTGAGVEMGKPIDAFVYPPGIATARGTWVQNKVYESTYPGADGDRWFHMDMKATPGTSITNTAMTTVTLGTVLPAAGATTFVVHSTAYVIPPMSRCQAGEEGYQLQATVFGAGGSTETLLGRWNPAPGCVMQPTSTVTFTTNLAPQAIRLRFVPNADYPTAIKLEKVSWEQTASLNFAGAANGGADFWSEAEGRNYAFTNLPASWQLYDVTEPRLPKVAAKGGAGSASFNQFGRAPVSHYVLANLSAVHQPAVQLHTPINFSGVKAANALYIGPAQFADEVAPLLALRSQEGFVPLFVDVQQIYDVYNYGHVSATAIRNFLRQESDWQNTARRVSVVLVGDGTHDPHDYEGKANPNYVTPYMDDVDEYIKEAPCDQCYAQLHGDDPKVGDNKVDGSGQPIDWFAADIWLGRFPVRNETELADVVDKIITYETTGADQEPWRSRHVLLADNYILRLDNQTNAQLDAAGDFALFSDNVRALFPANAQTQRVYFDPAPARQVAVDEDGQPFRVGSSGYVFTEPRTSVEEWRVSDPTGVNAAAIGALSGGSGLVTYNGHSNHFYFARTREDGGQPNWVFYTNDVAVLGNVNKPFVMLSMTCYTAQFSKPTGAGTVDELLFRRKEAGAVAVWGPAGLTIVHGHDLLQTGFMKRLWTQPAMSQRIGGLIEAGYLELLTQGTCCQDALMTFLLFGDPLTRARVAANGALYMPQVSKR